MSEIRSCPSYPGYSVSRLGIVYSHWRRIFGIKGRGSKVVLDPSFNREMRSHPNKRSGYIMTNITVDGKERYIGVHSMLLDAFVGPCPLGLQCRHLDGDKTNNDLGNLCWGTALENAQDRMKHGCYGGERHPLAKLTEEAVRDIRSAPKFYGYRKALAKKHNVSDATVQTVLAGRTWRQVK